MRTNVPAKAAAPLIQKTSAVLGDYFIIRRELGSERLPTLSVTLNDGLVRRESLDRRTKSGLDADEHLTVRRGDIAYNMMRMWQGACGLAEEDGIVSPAYVVATPKSTMDARFAYHWFKSPRMLYLFWAYSHGLTGDRLRLYFENFAEVPVDPPPIAEQRRVATVLDTWDRAIATTEAMIAAKRRRFSGLFQQLLPAHTSKLPSGWMLEPISAVADVRFSTVNKKTVASERKIRLCNYMDVYNNRRITDDLSLMEATATEREINAFSLVEGDVLFTKDSETADDIAVSAVVAEPLENVVCGYHLGIARPKPKRVLGAFLAFAMRYPRVRHEFSKRANGATRFGLTLDALDEVEIFVPPITEQTRLAAVLSAAEAEVELLERKAERLRLQKRGLLQRLLDRWGE